MPSTAELLAGLDAVDPIDEPVSDTQELLSELSTTVPANEPIDEPVNDTQSLLSELNTLAPTDEPVNDTQNILSDLNTLAPVEEPGQVGDDGLIQAAKNLGTNIAEFGEETVKSFRRANAAEDAAEKLADIVEHFEANGSIDVDNEFVRGFAALLKVRQDLGENRAILKIISSDNAAQAFQNLIENPSGIFQAMVEQYPDILEQIAGQVIGGVGGGALGTLAAPGIGTAVGAVSGSVLTSIPIIRGNAKIGYLQGQIQRHLASNKLELTDQNIVDFMNSEDGKIALNKANTYANVITTGSSAANLIGAGAITSASAKIAGKLGLELAVQGGKIVVKDGIRKKAIDFVGATGSELAGEVSASKAIGDDISAGELMLELGTAGIEAAGDIATSRISTNINRGTNNGQATPGSETQQSDNVDQSGQERTAEERNIEAARRASGDPQETPGDVENGERGPQGETDAADRLGDDLGGLIDESQTPLPADRTAQTLSASTEISGEERLGIEGESRTQEIQSQIEALNETDITPTQTNAELELNQTGADQAASQGGDTGTQSSIDQEGGDTGAESSQTTAQQEGEGTPGSEEKSDQPVRAFSDRLSKDDRIPEEVRELLTSDTYTPITNADTRQQVEERIKANGVEQSIRDVKDLSTDINLTQRITAAQVLSDKLAIISEEADKLGDTEASQNIQKELYELVSFVSERGTESGQAIQAFTLWNRLSPEGVILAAQRELKKIKSDVGREDKAPGDRARKTKIPEKVPQPILDSLARIARDTQKLRKEGKLTENAEIVQAVFIAEELGKLQPPLWLDKLRTSHTISQLFNPKTQSRNVLGNTFSFVGNTVSEFVSIPIDALTSVVTGKRVKKKATLALVDRVKGLAEPVRIYKEGVDIAKHLGYIDNKSSFLKNIKYGTTAVNAVGRALSAGKLDLENIRGINTTVLSSTAGRMLENTLTFVMATPDIAAYRAQYNASLRLKMEAAGVTLPTSEILKEAQAEAMASIYQLNTDLAKGATKLRSALNRVSALGYTNKAGLGELTLKYTRVPANLIRRGIAYTPIEFVNTLYQAFSPTIFKNDFDQTKFVNSFSNALVGTTGVFGLGMWMASRGFVIERLPEEDDEITKANKEIGISGYQVNISAIHRALTSGNFNKSAPIEGDILKSYDWAQPLAMSFSMGADVHYSNSRSEGFSKTAMNSLNAALASILEQPLLSGMMRSIKSFGYALDSVSQGEAVKGLYDFIVSSASEYPISLTPTILGQEKIRRDNIQRETLSDSTISTNINRLMNKLPYLSETLPPKISVLTGEKLTYGKISAWQAFGSPAITKELKRNIVLEELNYIFQETGETKAIPKPPRKTIPITVDGVRKRVQPDNVTRSNMKQFIGDSVWAAYTNMIDNNPRVKVGRGYKHYYSMTPDEQGKALAKILTNVNTAAKIIFLDHAPKSVPNIVKDIVKEYESS